VTLSGKTVLVTGADGFIGSHLAEELVRKGARVKAFCLYNSLGSRGWLDGVENRVDGELEFLMGDIRDARFVESACKNVDTVFHLAALVAIPYSYVAPHSFVETNILGTLNVLEGVRRGGVARMINTSTSEVYGTPDSLPITEQHPLKGQSPYSASKIAADKMCEAFFASFGTPVTTLRPFNTYGPRQSARAVIPTILAQILSGKRCLKLGSLEPKRDLTFVRDTIAGFLAAAEGSGLEGQTVQLGTGRTESIGKVVEIAAKVCGADVTVEQEQQRVRPSNSEVMVLQSDPSLARRLLGWSASTSLEEGMSATADWLRENMDKYRAHSYAI
jgi:NAD dependent epimerase/dehydratase